MQKYLVTKYKYFIDPHGESDDGGTEKFVSSSRIFGHLDCSKYYVDLTALNGLESIDRIEGWIKDNEQDEDDLSGSEDGYNSVSYGYRVEKITDLEALRIEEIINQYNKL